MVLGVAARRAARTVGLDNRDAVAQRQIRALIEWIQALICRELKQRCPTPSRMKEPGNLSIVDFFMHSVDQYEDYSRRNLAQHAQSMCRRAIQQHTSHQTETYNHSTAWSLTLDILERMPEAHSRTNRCLLTSPDLSYPGSSPGKVLPCSLEDGTVTHTIWTYVSSNAVAAHISNPIATEWRRAAYPTRPNERYAQTSAARTQTETVPAAPSET